MNRQTLQRRIGALEGQIDLPSITTAETLRKLLEIFGLEAPDANGMTAEQYAEKLPPESLEKITAFIPPKGTPLIICSIVDASLAGSNSPTGFLVRDYRQGADVTIPLVETQTWQH